jgi:hypothetical protein
MYRPFSTWSWIQWIRNQNLTCLTVPRATTATENQEHGRFPEKCSVMPLLVISCFPDYHVQHLVWSRWPHCLASELAGPTPPDFFACGFKRQCAYLVTHRHGWSKDNDRRSLPPNHVGDVEWHVVKNWPLVINSVALRANYMIHSLRSLQVICVNVNRCNFTFPCLPHTNGYILNHAFLSSRSIKRT